MAKTEHALVERFIEEHRHDLRCVAGQWTRWDGRAWREISAASLIEMFRAGQPRPETPRGAPDEKRTPTKDDDEDDLSDRGKARQWTETKAPRPEDCIHAAKIV